MKRYCKKCFVDTDRDARGDCKPCSNKRSALRRLKYPEEGRERVKNWKEANPLKYAKAKADWHEKNKEKENEKSRQWAINNKEKKRISVLNRRVRQKSSGVLSKNIINKLKLLQKCFCACGCGNKLEVDFHMDHIVPIALGGQNIDSNIQLLNKICNLQKSSKHPIDFMQSKGYLL